MIKTHALLAVLVVTFAVSAGAQLRRPAASPDPELQALVTKMFDRVRETREAAEVILQENTRLERENSALRARLGCS